MDQHVAEYYANRRHSRCPECRTIGYLILPGYGRCQTCLKLRLQKLRDATGEAMFNVH